MLSAILYFILIMALLYSLFILYVAFSWHHMPVDKIGTASDITVEVIVPIKNEETDIEACISSINSNSLETHRITVVDDGSSDGSFELAKSALRQVDKIIATHAEQRGKKYAIDKAISESVAEVILTTDGDSIVSPAWINSMIRSLNGSDVDLVLGPVFINGPQCFIDHFQQFDLIATMAVTGVGHYKKWFYSGSAACMAYKRETYNRLKPYADNFQIPSGDDIFFIEKIQSTSGQMHFIKQPDTFVLTAPVSQWKVLIKQRIRWAGKSQYYKHKGLNMLWAAVGLSLFCFCLGLLFLPAGIFVYSIVGIWIIKSIVDFILIFKVARFYKLAVNYIYFLPCFMLYPFFILFVGVASLIKPRSKW